MKNLTLQGIIQGLTEFLPISSSGHLLFIQTITKFKGPNLLVDIVLHTGTLIVILIFYFKDIKKIISKFLLSPFNLKNNETKLGWLIILGNIPTAIIGIFIKRYLPEVFETVKILIFTWGITGIALIFSDKLKLQTKNIYSIKLLDALIIGTAQGVAIFPGISRAGATITMALVLSIKREDAAKFSFLLGLPSMMGAIVMEVLTTTALPEGIPFSHLFIGFISSLIFGLIGILILLKFLKRANFKYFGIYLLLLVVIVIIIVNTKNK